jgi:hypothetical protein
MLKSGGNEDSIDSTQTEVYADSRPIKTKGKKMADKNVHLQVKAATPNVPPSWALCQNNSNYMYKYTGGNPTAQQPPGSFNFTHGQGPKIVDIDLVNSQGFSISSVTISYDPGTGENAHDLTEADQGDGTWRITDSDVNAESGNYEVFVNDGTTATNIECDPRWVND